MREHHFVARVIEDSDNRIHDDGVARRFGFAGALVPGVELFAGAAGALAEHWGQAWLSGGRIALRFRRPVYDGERLTVAVDDDGGLRVVGEDGEVRCVGSAAPPGPDGPSVDLSSYRDPPVPATLPPDPAPGPLGTVREDGTVEHNAWYLDAIGETDPLYRERSLAHPGLLLRLVNLLLMRNVHLGPWIHTASDCVLLAPARLPALMTARGVVTQVGRRGGHDEVRYDAVVFCDDTPVLHVHHTALYRLGDDAGRDGPGGVSGPRGRPPGHAPAGGHGR